MIAQFSVLKFIYNPRWPNGTNIFVSKPKRMSRKVTDSVRNVVLGAAIALAGVSPQAIAGPAQWVPLPPPG